MPDMRRALGVANGEPFRGMARRWDVGLRAKNKDPFATGPAVAGAEVGLCVDTAEGPCKFVSPAAGSASRAAQANASLDFSREVWLAPLRGIRQFWQKQPAGGLILGHPTPASSTLAPPRPRLLVRCHPAGDCALLPAESWIRRSPRQYMRAQSTPLRPALG